MRGDWIKLHRKAADTAVFADDWLWRLWCWCLIRARYRDGKGLKSGQFVTGRFSGSEMLGVSPSKFYRGLHRLEELGQITLEANSNRTTVTVVNWRTYQDDDQQEWTASEQQVNNQRTASEQPADTIEERKKERREEGKNNTEARAPKKPKQPKQPKEPTKPLPATDGYSTEFEAFWLAYPELRRKDKPKAWAAFKAAMKFISKTLGDAAQAAEYLIRRAKEYAASDEGNSQFVRGPTPWLNQQAWDDPAQAWRRKVDAAPSKSDNLHKKISEVGDNWLRLTEGETNGHSRGVEDDGRSVLLDLREGTDRTAVRGVVPGYPGRADGPHHAGGP